MRGPVVVLGLNQILAWGSSYYLIAVLGRPIVDGTGWPLSWVVGGPSLGLLVAGIVSRHVGLAIQRHGGRPVLASAAGLFALGLAFLAAAHNLAAYIAAWLIIGAAMGAGLYDAAFATLGRIYGSQARGAITGLTLFGGFASTVCWPLTAWIANHYGWRGACLAYAGAHLLVSLPLLLTLPSAALPPIDADVRGKPDWADVDETRANGKHFGALALILTIASAVMAAISVHVIGFLEWAQTSPAEAVAVAALIGPSQVGARLIDMALARRRHPVWTLLASCILVAIGIGLLFLHLTGPAVAMIAYGAGNGLNSIARGSMPLALFGPTRYAVWMGRLATPALFAGAVSPYAGSLAIEAFGTSVTLAILATLAFVNVLATCWLARVVHRAW